jgi:hypothetical protein
VGEKSYDNLWSKGGLQPKKDEGQTLFIGTETTQINALANK